MDTEALFATEALVGLLDQSIVVISDDEDEEIHEQADEGSGESELSDSQLSDPDIFAEYPTQEEDSSQEEDPSHSARFTQNAERAAVFNDPAIPVTERVSISVMRRFRKETPKFKSKPLEQRQLTQKELDMLATVNRELRVRKEIDTTLYDPTQTFVRQNDETHPEVASLTKAKGFISARQVHSIMSQQSAPCQSISSTSQNQVPKSRLPVPSIIEDSEAFESGVLTQLYANEKHRLSLNSTSSNSSASSSAKLKVAKTIAEAVIEDFEDIDNETLTLIQAEEHLNSSLDSLTQKLSDSQRAAELLTISQAPRANLDVSMDYHDVPTSDDEFDGDVKNTEALERSFMNFESQREVNEEAVNVPNTEDLESNFLNNLSTQFSQQAELCPMKHRELVTKPEARWPANKSLNQGLNTTFMSPRSLQPHKSPLGSRNDSPLRARNFQTSSGIGNTGMFSGFSLSSASNAAPAFVGFGLASGKAANINVETMNRILKTFEDEDMKIDGDMAGFDPKFQTPVAVKQFKVPVSSGFSKSRTALNNPSPLARLSTPESSRPSTSDEGFQSAQPAFSMGGFTSASGKAVSTKQNMRKFEEMFAKEDQQLMQELKGAEDDDDNHTPVKPALKKLRLDFGNSPVSATSPLSHRFNKGIQQHSTPLVKRVPNVWKLTDTQELSSIAELIANGSLDDTLDDIEPPRKKFGQIKLLDKFDESNDSMTMEDEIFAEEQISMLEVPANVKKARREALRQQQAWAQDKCDTEKAPMAGTVFMMKSSRNRTSIKDYVAGHKPKHFNHQITINNAIDFKFSMKNFVTEEICKTNTAGISIGDSARLVMDEQSMVGLEEIKWSFLASPGVDPKLATEDWIANTFRMLVLKLAWLENSFEAFEKALSPENLMLQMKYRYDREIDRSHRSAIKKIVELDEMPYRRMVLKVIEIVQTRTVGYELKLTDGWYAIPATIDASLADAVDRKKIAVGTKLMICCAELRNCSDGYDPLQMPSSVQLKIHANSTRRTGWHQKLGVCSNPNPIRISLDSVLATGGTIGKLRVAVTHVYPMVYVDSSKGTKEFRSEKHQHRIQNKLDVLNHSLFEILADQVQREVLNEIRERVDAIKASKVKLGNLTPMEVCDLMDVETEPDELMALQSQVSSSMMKQVEDLRSERSQQLNQRISDKMGENDKHLSLLFRFRVVDAINPNKTGIVSCWSPTEEMMEMIREGQVIEIINSTAGQYGKEIQVNVGKSAAVKIAPKVSSEGFKEHFRRETRIADINSEFIPPQDEFDVACVVVRVEAENENNFQKVYVADERMNIMCVNFWSSLSEKAFDDVVTEGAIVFAKNLQWRASHASNKIPQAFVRHDITIFTVRPGKEAQRLRLDEIKFQIGNVKDFVTKCNERIAEFQAMSNSTDKENDQQRNQSINQSRMSPTRQPFQSTSMTSNSIIPPTTSERQHVVIGTKRLGICGGFTRSFHRAEQAREKMSNKPFKSRHIPPYKRSSFKY